MWLVQMKYFLIRKASESVLEKRAEKKDEIQSGFYIFITKTECQEDLLRPWGTVQASQCLGPSL